MTIMCLCNELCSAVRLPWQNTFKTLDITRKLSNHFFFHACHGYRHHLHTILYRFHWSWACLGSQGQRKIKPIGFIFSHTFHLIRMKFDVVIKQFKLNTLRVRLLLSMIYENNNCCFTDSMKKNPFNIRMHLDVYKLIWFKLGIMRYYCILHLWLYYCTLHLDTRLIVLDLDLTSQECRKAKLSQCSIDLNGENPT